MRACALGNKLIRSRNAPAVSGYGGMADVSDSKSDGGDLVWVQVPLSAL